jgi:hypothetical protein
MAIFTEVSYREGNKWNRNAYQKCNREKKTVNMETCAYNTGYYEWLCVRLTLRITQYLKSKRVSTCRWFCINKKVLKVGLVVSFVTDLCFETGIGSNNLRGGRHHRLRHVS